MTSAAQDRHTPGTTCCQQLRRRFGPDQRLCRDWLDEYLADRDRCRLGVRPSGDMLPRSAAPTR
jgi:hypothetical protein